MSTEAKCDNAVVRDVVYKYLLGVSPALRTTRQMKDDIGGILANMNFNLTALGFQLKTLEDSGRLHSKGRYAGKAFGVAIGSVQVTAVKSPDLKPDNLKVDIIKATGRVRLTMGGLVIEIGVV